MVKGYTTPLIIITLFVAAAIIISAIDLNLPWIQGRTSSVVFQEKIYAVDKALDAAMLYAETSAKYSIYQACHDNLINPSTDKNEFIAALTEDLNNNINKYADANFVFLNDYVIEFPEYDFVYNEVENKFLLTGEKLSYEREDTKVNETVTLERDSTLQLYFICGDVYSGYADLRKKIETDVPNIIQQELDKPEWPKGQTNDPLITIDCGNLFQAVTGKTINEASTEMSQNIRTEIQSILPQSDTNFEYETEIPDVPVVIKGEFIQQDAAGTVCEFTYDASVTMTLKIKDLKQEYTVYDIDAVKKMNPVATISGTIKTSGFVQSEAA